MAKVFAGGALVLLAAVLAVSCCEECPEAVQGSGHIATRDMEFADFTAVEASHAFVVDIDQAEEFSVTVRVDDNILDLLDVSKDGDTLVLQLDRNVSLSGDVTLEASITMPELSRLGLSGASRANVSGFQSSGDLDMELSGASRLEGDLEASNVEIQASGASLVTLEGSASSLAINASGASNLHLGDFSVDTAEVSLSGASEATLNAQERIDPVDLSGASTLRYKGDPALGSVSTAGGSTLEALDD